MPQRIANTAFKVRLAPDLPPVLAEARTAGLVIVEDIAAVLNAAKFPPQRLGRLASEYGIPGSTAAGGDCCLG